MEKNLNISRKFLNISKPDGAVIKIFLKRVKITESSSDRVKQEEKIHEDFDTGKITELDFFKKKFDLLAEDFDFNNISDLTADDMVDIIMSLKELSLTRRTLEEKKSQG